MKSYEIHFQLIANHLRDIHNALEEHIFKRKHWTFEEISGQREVVELAPLLGLAMKLESFSSQPQQQIVLPNISEGGE